MTTLLRGGCHCGLVTFELAWPGDPASMPARRCGCTFCRKHGGVWTSHPDARLEARVPRSGQVSRYTFGTGTAEFVVCGRCGVVPLVTCAIDGRLHAVVNVHTLDDVDVSRLAIAPATFEGEGVGDRLARRQRHWIADVRMEEGDA